ncbi:MAG TPA: cytochrome P450 [Jatrophihabitantaceae bacterium]|nr:cytochrome P450 [Jatrophihabitantaceae bacterium]
MTQIHDRPLGDDLFAPDINADPYSYFGDLRENDPVHWNERYQVWIVTRYDDVSWINMHPEVFSSEVPQRDTRPPYPPIDDADLDSYNYVQRNQSQRIITADRPRHRTLRNGVSRYFTPAAVERWRPLIQGAVDRLLSELDGERMDVVRDFAIPFPLLVICELMAIPASDRLYVRQIAEDLLIGPRLSPSRMREIADAMKAMNDYMEPLVQERLVSPGDDLISILAEAERSGDYSHDEVMQNLAFFVVAGHETTINLICNAMLAFAQHPDQWALLKADPAGLAAGATEEALRFDPPVKSIERIALEDTEFGGKQIKALDRVRWVIAAANRDPRRYPAPDTFDITRNPNPHLAFGHGIHTCLGAALTRVEGQVTFQEFGERFGQNLRLETDPVEHAAALHLRSLKSLNVSWS